ncbi:hypothetical protein ACIA5C_43555 [Actinoplanes sp. NPDC051343]|uniref:hypothetical protein n=1 Tax=Actinoplanes sp. NPDC051343 TaxID=3363906 RepID=UPI00379A65B0
MKLSFEQILPTVVHERAVEETTMSETPRSSFVTRALDWLRVTPADIEAMIDGSMLQRPTAEDVVRVSAHLAAAGPAAGRHTRPVGTTRGYADDVRDTGFHPLDGDLYLRHQGWPDRIAADRWC